ncbi:MAG TPA: DNA mismatch repair endonuclease MutL [Saprospiraceae bacterium]|nr:DNA mismatch repair endonuclease MutL [Saprospiraceae bacterium]
MADIIQLLPDAIANQIAAGEVIQRPASVAKELLENAVDAGSTKIQLIIKDAGKTLLQVIDNGCGMSETDARMSFERHATSKIRSAQDLFAIRTMGFRGEAMASIAAVAQVEMKTRQKVKEMGHLLRVEASSLVTQEPCQAAPGTSIAVKNLFYNVPARRNFLKSDPVELKHILEEFNRIAMANPDIHFIVHRDNEEIHHLMPGNLRQRIVGLFGSHTNKKLIPVEETTDIVRIKGYVGKPEFAKKTRGDQYFFVNNRFIKSGYLHHALMGAYEELISRDHYPFYVIFIEIDPAKIDINVHPTKQEIKFDDERLVYNYLKVTVRHALGQHHAMPSLDFERESTFNLPVISPRQGSESREQTFPSKASGGSERPSGGSSPSFSGQSQRERNNLANWEKMYEGMVQGDEEERPDSEQPQAFTVESSFSSEESEGNDLGIKVKEQKEPYQIHHTYILNQIKSGFILIDQQAAHERILYEAYLEKLQEQSGNSQQQLFTQTVELTAADTEILLGILDEINTLGFDIQHFGKNTFVINGLPAELVGKKEESKILDQLIEQYKMGLDLKLDVKENIARSMARSAAVKRGQVLSKEEMQSLVDKLFACAIPFKSPTGRNCFHTFELDTLAKMFEG